MALPETAPQPRDATAIDAALRAALADSPASQAAAAVARRFGLPRQDVYRRAVALQRGDEPDQADHS